MKGTIEREIVRRRYNLKIRNRSGRAVVIRGVEDGTYTLYETSSVQDVFICDKLKKWEHFKIVFVKLQEIKKQGLYALPRTVYSWNFIYSHLLDSGASCNTVNSAVYSTKWAHKLNNLTDPTDNSVVTSLQEAGRRIACPKKSKKDQVTTEMLIDLCTQFKDCKDLLIIRYLTMILLCFAGFLRYDEISSLLCKNLWWIFNFVYRKSKNRPA